MELEQRVQALEQEVQLLKNQIQVTLLEIQEQLLNNRYPALRADTGSAVGSASDTTGTAEDPSSSSSGYSSPASPTRPIRVPSTGFDPEATQISPPRRHREVYDDEDQQADMRFDQDYDDSGRRGSGSNGNNGSSQNNRNTQNGNGNRSQRSPQASSRSNGSNNQRQRSNSGTYNESADQIGPIDETDWTSRADLEYWTRQSIKRSGVQRARQMIYDYAAKGRYNLKVRDHLLRYVEQYEPDNPMNTILMPDDEHFRDDPATRNYAVNRIEAPQERPNRPSYSSRAENNTRKNQSNPDNSNNHRSSRKGVSSHATNGNVTPRGDGQSHPDDQSDPEQSVVLRLIAGVANAGAGVTWRKKPKAQEDHG